MGSPRSWQQQRRRQFRKHKIQRVWVNVSNRRGVGVFTGSGYWRWWWQRRIGRGICNASEGSKTTTEVAGDWRRSQRIYNEDRGGGGGRWTQRLQQRQWMRWRRIYDASKGSKTTTEATAGRRRARWIGNDNIVLVFLDFRLLTVTLSRLCLVSVSFWCCFYHIPFFHFLHEILSVLKSCGKYLCTECTLTLRMHPLLTGE